MRNKLLLPFSPSHTELTTKQYIAVTPKNTVNAAACGFGGVLHLIVKAGKSFQNVQRGENKVQSIYTDIISKKSVSFHDE